MTERFVSYAQNGEDVLLWRALRHIERGAWVDVGAQDPVVDSVTLHFSKCGWRGLNIEPSATYHALLKAQRPDDVNVRACAGSVSGSVVFYDVPGTGLSTTSADVAAEHRAQGRVVNEERVPIGRLSEFIDAARLGTIHFMKIDVEGAEADVLDGIDFTRHRPWILVVEATRPNSQVPAWQSYDARVLAAGYRYAWFDGLNRYYIADERPELVAPLAVQPNYFDDYVPFAQVRLREQLDQTWAEKEALRGEQASLAVRLDLAEATVREQNALRNELEARYEVLEGELLESREQLYELGCELRAMDQARLRADAHAEREAQARARVQAVLDAAEERVRSMLKSRSWRITAPLRRAADAMRRVRALTPDSRGQLARDVYTKLQRMPKVAATWRWVRPRLPKPLNSFLARVRARLDVQPASASTVAPLTPSHEVIGLRPDNTPSLPDWAIEPHQWQRALGEVEDKVSGGR
jgi:FkbM family methyltransferase